MNKYKNYIFEALNKRIQFNNKTKYDKFLDYFLKSE